MSGQLPSCVAGHHDQVPLQALGPVRGEHGHRVGLRGACSASVSLGISWPAKLSRNSRVDPCGSRAREPGRRVEQGDDGVQVTVGGLAAGAARGTRRLPGRAEPGRCQTAHEHLVRGARRDSTVRAAGPSSAARRSLLPSAVRRARSSSAATRWPAAAAGRRSGPAAVDRAARWPAGGGPAAGRRRGRRRAATGAAAQAERVGTAQRPGEQVGGDVLVERAGLQGAAQQREQRPSTRLRSQRQLIARHDRGNTSCRQGPAQQRNLAHRRAHQDRHRGHQGTPSTRCARRSVSAMTAASWLALAATRIRTVPGSAVASGRRSRWARPALAAPADLRRPTARAPAPGRAAADRYRTGRLTGLLRQGGAATRREAASSTGPLRGRCAARRCWPGRSSGVRNRLGKRPHGVHIGPAERVNGLVRVPHRDELTAVTRQRVQQGFLGRVGVLILVDPAPRRRPCARGPGSPPGSAALRQSGRSPRSRRPGLGPGRNAV